MTKLIVVLAAMAAMVPAAATAEPFTPELEAEYHAALVEWGAPDPPPQCSKVVLEVVPDEVLLETPNGRARAQATTPPPGVLLDACHLWLGESTADLQSCELQETLEHEAGHLLGFGHNDNPDSIMAPAHRTSLCDSQEIDDKRADLQQEVKWCHRQPRGWRHRWCTPRVRIEREILAGLRAAYRPLSFP